MISGVGTYTATATILATAMTVSTVPATAGDSRAYSAPSQGAISNFSREAGHSAIAPARKKVWITHFPTRSWFEYTDLRSEWLRLILDDVSASFTDAGNEALAPFVPENGVRQTDGLYRLLSNIQMNVPFKIEYVEPSGEEVGIYRNLLYLKSAIADANPVILADAAKFYEHVKALSWQPIIWGDDGEIAFEWIDGERHAIVSFDGGGRYGYALRRGESFKAGTVPDPTPETLPADLRDYLG